MVRIESSNAEQHDISLLLQRGVFVEMPDAQSVSGFIRGIFGIDESVFHRDFKTLFLNNRVVDRPEKARLHAHDTLILSGAMPGLVGAMLRSGSPLKAMRSTISDGNPRDGSQAGGGMIRIKLFNTALKKYRGKMIENGFWIESE